VSSSFRAGGATARPYGPDPKPHIIRVAGAPQNTFSTPGMRVAIASRMSLQDKALGGVYRLMDGFGEAGAKLAPSALLDGHFASANTPSSDFLDLRPMKQTLFPAAR
jgi:hypothetical protein